MSKNTVIGLLIAVLVIGGGYFLLKKPATPAVVDQTPTDSTPVTPAPTPVPPVSITPGIPTVQTSSNSGPSASGAILTGTVTPNGAMTTYWFDYGETAVFGARNTEQSIGSGYASIPAPAYITGLKANTLYYFRLNAKNAFGSVSGTTYSFSTNNTPAPKGVAPTSRTNAASSVSRTTVNISGQVNPNGFATTYWFEYGKDSGLGNATVLQSAGSGNSLSTVSVSLSNLDPLMKYYFRMNAQNAYGTANGSIMSFTTTGPANPVSAPVADTTTALNIATTTAELTGRIIPNGGETTSWFEYSEDSLLSKLIGNGTGQQNIAADGGTTNVHANISGLRTKTTYYYRLVGRNSAGTTRGSIVSFKTK